MVLSLESIDVPWLWVSWNYMQNFVCMYFSGKGFVAFITIKEPMNIKGKNRWYGFFSYKGSPSPVSLKYPSSVCFMSA